MTEAIEIPIPPPVNRLWQIVNHGKRRSNKIELSGKKRLARSRDYESWLQVAVPLMRIGLPVAAVPTCVFLSIRAGKGWNNARDLDNTMKAVLDAMVSAQRLQNDNTRYVRSVHVQFADAIPGQPARCEVGYTDPETILVWLIHAIGKDGPEAVTCVNELLANYIQANTPEAAP